MVASKIEPVIRPEKPDRVKLEIVVESSIVDNVAEQYLKQQEQEKLVTARYSLLV